MRRAALLIIFMVDMPVAASDPAAEAAAAIACLTSAQRQELFGRITSASASVMFSSSMGMSGSFNEASAAHSRALAALHRCETQEEEIASDRCSSERAIVAERAKVEADLAAEKRRRMAEARASLPGIVKSIRAEYPDCEPAR